MQLQFAPRRGFTWILHHVSGNRIDREIAANDRDFAANDRDFATNDRDFAQAKFSIKSRSGL